MTTRFKDRLDILTQGFLRYWKSFYTGIFRNWLKGGSWSKIKGTISEDWISTG